MLTRNSKLGGSLDNGTLRGAQDTLEQHNPLVQQFQAAATLGADVQTATIVIDQHGARVGPPQGQPAAREGEAPPALHHALRPLPGHVGRGHARQWNAPTADQVAALMPGDGTTATKGRTVTVRLRGGGLTILREHDPAFLPAHFVLLFPYGEPGAHDCAPRVLPRYAVTTPRCCRRLASWHPTGGRARTGASAAGGGSRCG